MGALHAVTFVIIILIHLHQTKKKLASRTVARYTNLLYHCACCHIRTHHWPIADRDLQAAWG
jgi:hypothetical protein